MENQKMILIALLFLVVVGFKPSIGARLLENGLFTSPENPSAFDPKLNSVVQESDSFKNPNEKTRLPCGESKSEEVVLNVLAKGSVTPSGSSQRGNNGILNAQRLAKSKHSPGVGHLQIFNTLKSSQKSQQHVSNKRILKSTPSPGAGH